MNEFVVSGSKHCKNATRFIVKVFFKPLSCRSYRISFFRNHAASRIKSLQINRKYFVTWINVICFLGVSISNYVNKAVTYFVHIFLPVIQSKAIAIKLPSVT